MSDGAVFMSDPDNVVRYHRSGITVSRTQDAGDLVGVGLGLVLGVGSSEQRDVWKCITIEPQPTRLG